MMSLLKLSVTATVVPSSLITAFVPTSSSCASAGEAAARLSPAATRVATPNAAIRWSTRLGEAVWFCISSLFLAPLRAPEWARMAGQR